MATSTVQATSNLVGSLHVRAELAPADLQAMYGLFAEHFAGAQPAQFEQDLADKNWVILLHSPIDNTLHGFSTLALYTTQGEAGPISVVYSGDTIIRPAFWGTPALPLTWINSVLALTIDWPQPLYWLLISSGYKTYRFLPIFYRDFYPRYDQPTPPVQQQLLNRLAHERFGEQYDAATGLVRFRSGGTPLRPGVADLTHERLRDPHVAYFVARNPAHARGDELVCLTRIHPDNLTRAGQRMRRGG